MQISRDKMVDQIGYFSADLNTSYKKGPLGKQKKVIFKWLQAGNKENVEKTYEDAEGKPQVSNVATDQEKCYKIMLLQNTKVSKILKDSRSSYEDRKNGIIRVPTPAPVKKPSKTGKKKKAKKKINTGIDFTIVVKGEDQKVEEIRVRDANMKKTKNKKKPLEETKQQESASPTSDPSHSTIIQKYMEALENSYQKERKGKDLKKVKIKASARIIQKAWKFYSTRKNILTNKNFENYHNLDSTVVNKVIVIQKYFKEIKQRIKRCGGLKRKVKEQYFGRKIFNRLKWLNKRKLSIKNFNQEESEEIIQKYQEFPEEIMTIQNFITGVVRAKVEVRKLLKIYQGSKFLRRLTERQSDHQKTFHGTKHIDTELIRRISY